MGIKMFNINSPYNVKDDTLEFALNNSGILNNLAQSVPVYLVDKDLMDAIRPPQIWPLMTPECIQEMVRSFHKEYGLQLLRTTSGIVCYYEQQTKPENIETVFERLRQSEGPKIKGSYAVNFSAVYCQSLCSREAEEVARRMRVRIPFTRHLGENRQSSLGSLSGVPTLEDIANYQKFFGALGRITSDSLITGIQSIIEDHRQAVPRNEAIFICMERIVRAASRIKETWDFRALNVDTLLETVFAAYLLQQLAYAYMKTETGRYYTPWGQIMEEGLVAAHTMSCFKDELSRAVLRAHLSRQPLEFLWFAYFESFSQAELQRLLRIWKRNNVRHGLESSRFRKSSAQYPHVQEQSRT